MRGYPHVSCAGPVEIEPYVPAQGDFGEYYYPVSRVCGPVVDQGCNRLRIRTAPTEMPR